MDDHKLAHAFTNAVGGDGHDFCQYDPDDGTTQVKLELLLVEYRITAGSGE